MQLIKKSMVLGIVVGSFLGVAALVQPAPARAQENNQAQQTQNQPAADTYQYVAQTDDSYSVLARKAIQTYGIENKVNLSQAQIIAAETWLTQDAGSPILNEGQKVSIEKTTVKKFVEQAQKLSKEQQALWQPYTVGVNFDTRNNGQ